MEAEKKSASRKFKTRKRKRVELPTSKQGGGVLPGVDLNNSASLLDLMELDDNRRRYLQPPSEPADGSAA